MIEFVVRRIMEMGEAEDPEKVWLEGRGTDLLTTNLQRRTRRSRIGPSGRRSAL